MGPRTSPRPRTVPGPRSARCPPPSATCPPWKLERTPPRAPPTRAKRASASCHARIRGLALRA
eukprot:4041360-Prymnesium_polylepis.1